jgi:hypothetical protein
VDPLPQLGFMNCQIAKQMHFFAECTQLLSLQKVLQLTNELKCSSFYWSGLRMDKYNLAHRCKSCDQQQMIECSWGSS